MTSGLPAQCFACVHREPLTDPDTGGARLGACNAYPDGIPFDIAIGGADHREVRGDERNGHVFHQADGPEAADAFLWWERTFAGAARA